MSAQRGPDVGHRTHPGRRRERNEDSYGLPPPDLGPEMLAAKGRLYVVADGVGGHRGGEEASRLAVQRLVLEYYRDTSPDWRHSLTRAIRMANAEVFQTGQRTPGAGRMATTVTAAVVRGPELLLGNVGDSRVYLVRGGAARQLTQDHSLIAEGLRSGTITPEQAGTHPFRGQITRALGKSPDVQADVTYEQLQPGDTILLCSDGLVDEVPDGQIAATITHSRNAQDAANQLVNQANQAGGRDNVTAVVVSLNSQRPAALFDIVPPWMLAAGGGLLALLVFFGLLLNGSRQGSMPTPAEVTAVTAVLPATEVALAPESTAAPGQATAVTPTPSAPAIEPATADEMTATALAASVTAAAQAAAGMTATASAAGPDALGPTSTWTPTNPPTDTPQPSPAPTQGPSATATQQPGPIPIKPADGLLIEGIEQVELAWEWGGTLAEDEYYDVQVWRPWEEPEGITWTKKQSYLLDIPKQDRLTKRELQGTYYWAVAVVQGNEAGGKGQVTWIRVRSDEWRFDWKVQESGERNRTPQPDLDP